MSDVNAGELFAALAKAQGIMGAAHKDKTNPHFRSKYADLASCWDACREPLAANGLCVIQTTDPSEGYVVVVTTLGHSSGISVASRTSVPMDKKNAHGFGAALTYARRYGLMAMVGICPGEDDGNKASGVKEEKPWRQTKEGRAIAKLFAKCPNVDAGQVRTDLDNGANRVEVLAWLKAESKRKPEGCAHPKASHVKDKKGAVSCCACGQILEPAVAAGAVGDNHPDAF